ncbi:MAG: D-aminoacyl-tRNA deacylase [Lysobacterales bacterium]
MIALLQRVTQASVSINGTIVGNIESGLLVLVGVQPEDTQARASRLLERILNYRVFSDADGRMNHSLRDLGGGLLLVPQFTLAADTKKGNRPGFSTAAAPELGEKMFQYLYGQALGQHNNVAGGQFGADMQVSLTNDGPVTFWLEV